MKKAATAVIAIMCLVLIPGIPAAQTSQEPSDEGTQAYRYAHIEMEGTIPEILPPVYLLEPDIDTFFELTGRLSNVAEDETIGGLILAIKPFDAGWAKVQELRQHILRCRRAGKKVICYMEGGGNKGYYLASAADRVVLVPSGSLMLVGLRAEVMFLKGLLDMVGLQGDFVQVGKYKGASEPFTRKSASEAFAKSLNALVDDMYRQLLEDIARGRDVEVEQVKSLIDKGPYTPERALEAGLVDQVDYYDQLLRGLRRESERPIVIARDYGEEEPRKALISGPEDMFKILMGVKPAPEKEAREKKAVAVVYAVGPVIREELGDLAINQYMTSAADLREDLRDLVSREDVKAIVVRVDSPGGSAVASDIIWRELRRANREKPVLVSLSDTAASGGYYIAAAGRTVFAEPGTITGSIGVVGGKVVLAGLYEKLGLNVEVFQRGRNAGIFSSSTELSSQERQRLQELLQSTYQTFLERIVESRDMSLEKVKKGAEGQPWSGYQAHERGLVDRLGGLRDAIAAARKAAGISPKEEVRIIKRPEPKSILEMLLGGGSYSSDAESLQPRYQLPFKELEWARSYLNALRCLRTEPAAALMPAVIRVE